MLIALGSCLSMFACDKTKPVEREPASADTPNAEAPAKLDEPEPAPRTLSEAQPPPPLPLKPPNGPGPAYFAVGGSSRRWSCSTSEAFASSARSA